MPEDIPDKTKEYAINLERDNEKIINDIKSKINEKRVKIIGKAISDQELKIGNKFTKVFNGISLSLFEDEVEEIKKIKGVKAVYKTPR